jgi:hypothetical protein
MKIFGNGCWILLNKTEHSSVAPVNTGALNEELRFVLEIKQ